MAIPRWPTYANLDAYRRGISDSQVITDDDITNMSNSDYRKLLDHIHTVRGASHIPSTLR